jgi:hypothetical protein
MRCQQFGNVVDHANQLIVAVCVGDGHCRQART